MKRMIKQLALLVTLVFSLQILSPLATALALEPEPAPAAGSGEAARADAPVIAFDEQLAALQQALDEYEAAADDLRRNEAMARVRTLRQSLRDLDQQVRALWADTELKLNGARAQGQISSRPLERHQAMVQQYQAAIDLLEAQLDDLEAHHGSNNPVEAKGAARGLRDRLNDLDHKRVDKELGSGTLPYRPSQVPGREPVLGDSLIPAYDYGRQAVEQGIKGASPVGSLVPTNEDLAPAGEVEITPEIEDLAEMLGNNPVRIYEWVRNNIDYEPYFGTVKGAMQTLREMAGNDADQAALLIAILRAAGIPARYVRGTVDIPGVQAANWVGVTDPRTAANVFATGGVPVSALIGGGTVAGVRIEHVWVEAYVPYGSYRGAVAGSLSPTWVALDPSFKQYDDTPAVNLSQQAGMSADNFFNDLMATATVNETEDQLLAVDRDAVLALLNQRRQQQIAYLETSGQQAMPVSAIARQRTIRAEQLELLPASLPYQVQAVLGEYTVQPDTQHQRLQVTLGSLSYEAPIYQLAGRRLTLTYLPATPEDEAVAASYGGLYNTPAYLVDVKAQLKLDGQVLAEGSAVNMGYQQNLAMDFIQPGGYSERVDNLVTAGAFYAIVLNLQQVPERLIAERQAKLKAAVNAGAPATSEAVLGETLYITGLTYFLEVDKYSDYLADTGNITYYSQVSEGMTGLDLKVSSLFGAPYSARPGGMYIDVDRNIVSPYALDGDEHKVLSWMFLSGMASSAMEHEIFKQLYGAPAISAMKYLQEAAEEEIPIFTITAENAATLIPQLRVSSYVQSAVWDAVASGREVIIPQEAMRIYDWQGVGYIVLDPETGAAGYMIAGGWAGGSWLLDIDFDDLPRFIQGLLAFLNGLILGDFDWDGYDDPMLEKLRLLGQILSGLIAVGDIRDALAAAYRIYETGGAEGKLALVLSLIGIIPGLGDLIKTGKFAPEMIEAFTQQALKNIPPNQVDQAADMLRQAFGEGADDAIAKLAKQYDISEITSNGSDVLLKGSKYGTDLDMHMIGDGDDFIRKMGLDPSDASTANKGLIGEHAADYLRDQNQWDDVPGFKPPTEGQHGIDRIYRDQNGNLVVVEAKYTSQGGNIGKDILGSTENGRQMSNQWLQNAVNEMLRLGNITPELAAELSDAILTGTVRKELVVVQDVVSNGSTATKGLMTDTAIGLDGVTIINTGGVVGGSP